MPRWGMVIDLNRCVGCHSCTAACKEENFLPPGIFWNRVFDQETGTFPTVRRTFLPRPCMHCEDAPCVDACPTGATAKREDGIVTIDYDRCIGCCYCMVACPYDSRFFHEKDGLYFPGTIITQYESFGRRANRVGVQVHQVGVVEKCTFCLHRLEKAKEKAKQEGRELTDDDVWLLPACAQTCPTRARTFGDLRDPNSRVSKLIRDRHGFQLKSELNTKPCVYYLPAGR